MREHKYRIWDGKEMRTKVMDRDLTLENIVRFASVLYPNMGNAIWFEYTGLKDKRGKELYFDDFVNLQDDGCEEYRVTKDDFGVPVFLRQRDFKVIDFSDYFAKFDRDGFKIIGNIHENKELIEKGKND